MIPAISSGAVRTVLLAAVLFLGIASVASAHSTVSPSQTATSKYETFTLSLPTERDVPTTKVALEIPASLDHVTPFVKPGWQLNIIKDADGKVTRIEWTGGTVPAGQKDVFPFTARTADTEGTLIWKAYQTYQNGEVVAWDQTRAEAGHGDTHAEVANPYSITQVSASAGATAPEDKDVNLPAILSVIGFVLALCAFNSTRKNA